MGEQRAAGIEFLAIDDDMVAGVDELRLEVGRPLGAEFGERVAEPRAGQNFGEEQLLLGLIRDCTDRGDDAEVVLRNLTERGIGRRDDGDHL